MSSALRTHDCAVAQSTRISSEAALRPSLMAISAHSMAKSLVRRVPGPAQVD